MATLALAIDSRAAQAGAATFLTAINQVRQSAASACLSISDVKNTSAGLGQTLSVVKGHFLAMASASQGVFDSATSKMQPFYSAMGSTADSAETAAGVFGSLSDAADKTGDHAEQVCNKLANVSSGITEAFSSSGSDGLGTIRVEFEQITEEILRVGQASVKSQDEIGSLVDTLARAGGNKRISSRRNQADDFSGGQRKYNGDHNLSDHEKEIMNLNAQLDEIIAKRKRLNEEPLFYETTRAVIDDVGDAMTDMFDNIIEGTFRASEAFEELAKSIYKTLMQKLVVDQIVNGMVGMISGGGVFGGLFGGGTTGGGNTTPVTTGPVVFAAHGNAFDNGYVIPFATGGVVNSPTYFPLAGATGLMGEAGPEAIVPLRRSSSGDLGVSTPPVNVQVNVVNQSGNPVSASKGSQKFDGKQFVINTILKDIQSNGPTRQAIRGAI